MRKTQFPPRSSRQLKLQSSMNSYAPESADGFPTWRSQPWQTFVCPYMLLQEPAPKPEAAEDPGLLRSESNRPEYMVKSIATMKPQVRG
jgi:hypothetical protein